jgi:hypothetical protein
VSEPKAVAQSAAEVVPGLWHWHLEDERIGGSLGAAHAVVGPEGAVLVDPLPLEREAFARLGRIQAICLTSGSHQRSAWRLRRELGAPVWGPALAQTFEEEPDRRYGDGDVLPGELRAVFTPGAGTTQHTLLVEGEPGVAITPDLFIREPGGELRFVPAEYMDDPEEARRSAERLLDLPFTVLCSGHGVPVLEGAKDAIRRALAAR